MRLEYFEYLLEVAKYNNMRISSEALSICIKNMEEELGFAILERNPKGVTFTKDGQKLLDCAERILSDYRETLQAIHQQKRLKWNNEIYTTPIVNMCLGSNLVEKMKREYPYITVNIINDTPKNILELFNDASKSHDMMVILTMYNNQPNLCAQQKDLLTMQYCFSDKLVIAATKNHRLAHISVSFR